jgi:oligopeptide/dipeptide ABC transporter ATP-binding protein
MHRNLQGWHRIRGKPQALPGEPTSPIDPPQNVCLFASRCPLAVDRCRIERPQLRMVAGRQVACHRAEETGAAGPAVSELAAC